MPSAPLVPHNDPTLMFVNAGMVPFKNVFTGLETRPYHRATSSQKCVRAGGKHNDLDNVGYTARHHTFFEMLGNFSFGDYFKEQAITHAWKLLTQANGACRQDRLPVTVYHTDDEAFDLWKKIAGLPEERIIRIPTNGQFLGDGRRRPVRAVLGNLLRSWRSYLRAARPGRPEEDGDRFVEIWNLVFMQYRAGRRRDAARLPKPSIDTGMGLERIAAVLQGVHDNYDTDTFKALIARRGRTDRATPPTGDKTALAPRDRRSSALVGLPGRRRRAARERGARLCAAPDHAPRDAPRASAGRARSADAPAGAGLVAEMGAAYPELVRAQPLIEETLKLEETRFRQTLVNGLRLLDEATARDGGGRDAARRNRLQALRHIRLSLRSDRGCVARRRASASIAPASTRRWPSRSAAARAAWKGSGDKASDDDLVRHRRGVRRHRVHRLHADRRRRPGRGDRRATGRASRRRSPATRSVILTNQTPFYGESGGQIGDVGTITGEAGFEAEVTDTAKPLGRLHAHHGDDRGRRR